VTKVVLAVVVNETIDYKLHINKHRHTYIQLINAVILVDSLSVY